MNINIRKSSERGKTVTDWLDSKHSFSFGNYYNPANMHFRDLIVFNEDIIEAGKGFPTHHHDNAEVVSIVLEGELIHKDNQDNSGIITPGEVQRMSAGTGIKHSEYASKKEKVHLLQIWMKPKTINTKPSYEQKTIKAKKEELTTIVSGDKKDKPAVFINQEAKFLIGTFEKSKKLSHKMTHNNAYLFVIKGKTILENNSLEEGDAAEITSAKEIILEIEKDTKILIIEMK
ncbi:MAG: pirin family protein [Nanoarchaeota archaeon]